MKIALVSNYLPGSSKQGVGHQAHAMANQLVSRSHDVTVFSPSTPGDDPKYEWVHVHPGNHLRTFQFADRVRKLDFRGFDVLHAHGDDYLVRRSRVPHVRTMHGSCFAEALRIDGIVGRVRMTALGMSELVATAAAHTTVAVSNNTRRWYPWIRTVIPNGVDLDLFNPGPKSSHPTILFVGTYERRKRGRLLVEAFRRDVRPRIPDAELLMVCDDAPSSPGVTVLGRLSDTDLANAYRQAWAFSLPSTYEGFGVPYIEAMASGTAVVATRNPGSVEVLAGGELGVLCPDSALGKSLADLLLDEPRRRLMEAAGLVEVQKYAWAGVIDAYESQYRNVVAEFERR